MAFNPTHLYFEDLEVGQEWESPGRTITEADVVGFAGLSGDYNPIHTDHEFARATPFGRPVAHGLLVFSVGSGLVLHAPPVRTLAFLGIREWTFRGPVFIGNTIRARSKVLEKQARGRGRRGAIAWQRELVNQEGKVVQQGITLTLVEGRGAAAGAEGDEGGEPQRMASITA